MGVGLHTFTMSWHNVKLAHDDGGIFGTELASLAIWLFWGLCTYEKTKRGCSLSRVYINYVHLFFFYHRTSVQCLFFQLRCVRIQIICIQPIVWCGHLMWNVSAQPSSSPPDQWWKPKRCSCSRVEERCHWSPLFSCKDMFQQFIHL